VFGNRRPYYLRVPSSDLPASGSVSIEIDATASQVWPYICDPTVPARFSSELQEAEFLDGPGPSESAVIKGRNARGTFEWTTMSVVTDCEAPRLFRWATGDVGDPTATWTLEVTSAADGMVPTHSVVLHAGKAPLAPAIEKEPDRAREIVDARMAEVLTNMAATIAGIAALVGHDLM
jgi:hypothetical protein